MRARAPPDACDAARARYDEMSWAERTLSQSSDSGGCVARSYESEPRRAAALRVAAGKSGGVRDEACERACEGSAIERGVLSSFLE